MASDGVELQKKDLKAKEQQRPDVAEARRLWKLLQPFLEPHKLVFLDETALKTDMITRYGRAPVGSRCVDHAPAGHWSTTTLLTAVRLDGLIEEATAVYEGPVDAERFVGYAGSMLAPALGPGDVVVMDNLACHHREEVREAVESAGASVWYLPAYSPDLNPIEQAFSKIKQALRRAAARCWDTLLAAAVEAMRSVSPGDLRGYFAAAGYGA